MIEASNYQWQHHEKPCADCGKSYLPGDGRSKRCNRCGLARLVSAQHKPKMCAYCAVEFLPHRGDQKYCKPRCREDSRYIPKQKRIQVRAVDYQPTPKKEGRLLEVAQRPKQICGNCKWGQVFKQGQGETGYWCGREAWRACMGLDMRSPKLWEAKPE